MNRVLWFNPALVSQADVESIRAGVGVVKAEYGKAWGFYEEKPDWWVPSSKYLEPPYVEEFPFCEEWSPSVADYIKAGVKVHSRDE